jgi:arylsulfatase A-like enzyme
MNLRVSAPGSKTAWATALAASLAGAACSRVPEPPPSVLLISIDTLRADRLNAYGYTRRTTSPSIDALARDGVLFERHMAASPWTTPSHLSLLTSLSPSRHGVFFDASTMAHVLKTGRGYQRPGAGSLTLAEALVGSGWTTSAFTGGLAVDPNFGLGRGFASYQTNMVNLGPRKVDQLIRWIEGHRERPFFLFWHTFEVHAPYLRGRFLDEVLDARKAARVREELARIPRQEGTKTVMAEGEMLIRNGVFTPEVCSTLYDGGVRWADEALGRVLARLKELGLYDRMIIVITADHGEQLGDRLVPVWGGGAPPPGWCFYGTHGHSLYDEMIRVPLVVKLPDNAHAGRRVRTVTRAIDVMPTVLDVLRVPAKAPLEGVSLRAAWEGRQAPSENRAALSEALAYSYEKKALRDDHYKYIVTTDPATIAAHGRWYLPPKPAGTELYDLVADPGELRNLLPSPDPAVRATAQAMDAEMRRQLALHGQPDVADLGQGDYEGLAALGYVETAPSPTPRSSPARNPKRSPPPTPPPF